MLSRSSILIAFAIVLIPGSGATAQQSVRLESGARARLVSPSLPVDQQVVQIESVVNDTVVFRSEQNPVTQRLALSEISAVDVSLGQRRRTARGAAIGLASGVLLGGISGYTSYEPCEGSCIFEPTSRGGSVAWGATSGGLVGLVAGTTIGFFIKSEKWHRVHARTTVSVSPAPGGGALGVSHSF